MNTCNLANKNCIPCKGGISPLSTEELKTLMQQLDQAWLLIENHHIERVYTFDNFRDALSFVNAAGMIAEKQAHHPELTLTWGCVTIRIWTHKIDGLTENDFVLAAKTDRAFKSVQMNPEASS